MRFVKAGVASLLLFLPLCVGAYAQGESFALVPGVVIDPSADALYLMRPEGGIERISISSGSRSWESSRAAKPLAVAGNRLLAQIEAGAAELEVLVLDAGDGNSVYHKLSVELPTGVRPEIDERLKAVFVAGGGLLGTQPYLRWTHTERYVKGIAPGPDEPLQTTREAAYQVDLVTGGMAEMEPAATVPAAQPLPESVQAWIAAHPEAEPPTATGSVFAATRVVDGMTSPSGRIVLDRWDRGTGAPLPSVELFRGPHILQARSADQRHLLVTERRSPGSFDEYEWSVFSLETGARVGKLRHHQSHSPFFVDRNHIVLVRRPYLRRVDDELVHETLRLEARVLGSGSQVWERPLRDTTYRGPFPP